MTTSLKTAFSLFSQPIHARFTEMSQGELFTTECGDIFAGYLAAFPDGSNPIFRTRTEHDCNCCKQFVRRLGTVVSIKNQVVKTVWGGLDLPYPFKAVADAMDEYVRSLPITGVFRTKETRYGVEHNYDLKTHERYDHFYGTVAARHRSDAPATAIGEANATYTVMERGLRELRDQDLEQVLDLIDGNMIYRGAEHRAAVAGFRDLRRRFVASSERELFLWENLTDRNARFRNTAIGTLLVDLAEGKEIEDAVKSFETKVAPQNYKRTTSLITQKMVDEAVATLNDLGLAGAVQRRYAKLSDISVNDVLFVDNSARGHMRDGIAKLLDASVAKPKVSARSAAATAITADKFVKDVLPKATSLQVLLENRHLGNFVSLTGSDDPARLYKWSNPFAWSYDGDVTDSVKQRVKAAGGNIAADMRISLSWFNFDDLDLHCVGPAGHIYYGNKAGILDVDMNAGGPRTRTPVENLAFMKPKDGTYQVHVNQFRRRETIDFGFAIEFESNGETKSFSYGKSVVGDVPCFTLKVKDGKVASYVTTLTEGSSSQEKWGLATQSLIPVDAVCYSPNHWGDDAVGSKHLIFALRGCKNPDSCRGLYNEHLRGDLEKHRKVFEVLGAKTKCPPSDEQFSGLGFTAARGDSVTVVVDGGRSYTVSF